MLGVADRGDSLLGSLYFFNARISEAQGNNIATILSRVMSSIVDEPECTIEDILSRCVLPID